MEKVVLPELFKKRHQIKIWSAGCSTGEEPYTIAIVVDETMKNCMWSGEVSIIATDISTEVLKKAEDGIYSGRTLKFVSADIINKYFVEIADGMYRVSDKVKKTCTF